MSAIDGLLLLVLTYSVAVSAAQSSDSEAPGRASTEEPSQQTSNLRPSSPQARQGGLLGLFRAGPITIDTLPWSIAGDIDALDGINSDNLRYEDFRVVLNGGVRLRISATSVSMDPRLQVLAPNSQTPLMDDDDSGPFTNARLAFTPPETGIYILRVLGAFRGMNGPYRLSIESAAPLTEPLPTNGGAVSGTTNWRAFSGQLAPSDSSIEGLLFDDYRVTLASREELFIRLDSSDFDPVVQIFSANDREGDPIASDDDSGPGLSSLLIFKAPEGGGEYVVRATTFSSTRPTGEYTLRVGR